MENYLRKLLTKIGIYLPEKSSKEELLNLINNLKPINPGVNLVRIGDIGDGGYLLPDDFNGIQALISPGVGKLSHFEEYFANLGMNVYMADASVYGPTLQHSNFHFLNKFIGSSSGGKFITIDSFVRNSITELDNDLLLQMDIEGFEYEVILNMSDELLSKFRIVVIEFHYLDSLFFKSSFNLYSSVFNKILKTHECVHIHPNNCSKPVTIKGITIPPAMEFTFLRKDRIRTRKKIYSFPNKLDSDCVDYYPSIKLPKCWY